jgi:hypothetical protein
MGIPTGQAPKVPKGLGIIPSPEGDPAEGVEGIPREGSEAVLGDLSPGHEGGLYIPLPNEGLPLPITKPRRHVFCGRELQPASEFLQGLLTFSF